MPLNQRDDVAETREPLIRVAYIEAALFSVALKVQLTQHQRLQLGVFKRLQGPGVRAHQGGRLLEVHSKLAGREPA